MTDAAAGPVRLKEDTLAAFADYVRDAEAGMEETLRTGGPFLWSDAAAERARQVREGRTIAALWSGEKPVGIPDGLIHDWIGASFIPGATLGQTLALLQDYDNHRNVYAPEVIGSKLIGRNGDDFEIYLRLLKKKIKTVVLDTDHAVHYAPLDPARCCCHSRTTRIAEVENAGTPEEFVRAADTGYGFLWRLYSYWRFEERDGGVFIECRAISLTRDVPKALAWIIGPIVKKLPRESLIATLDATRRGVISRSSAG